MAMNQIAVELSGGRNRSRTCDLFLVMEALVPTELCALVSGGLYRRFTVRRERWRYKGTAAPGQRRDHATRREQAAHAEDDPGDAEQVGEPACQQYWDGDGCVDHREHGAEDAAAQLRLRLLLEDGERRDEEHAELQAADETKHHREGDEQPAGVQLFEEVR